MKLARARAIIDLVVSEAPSPVSVFVADAHGELVAAATMDGAAPDTRLNAQRKAYTAARSDARSTRELAEKVRDDPVERASFDPFFTFFLGGVAVFDGETRLGAVGVSGLPGEVDEQLALRAIEASGLELQPVHPPSVADACSASSARAWPTASSRPSRSSASPRAAALTFSSSRR